MRQIKVWLTAAILVIICGIMTLPSCSNDDDPAGQQDEYAGVPLIIYPCHPCCPIGMSSWALFFPWEWVSLLVC